MKIISYFIGCVLLCVLGCSQHGLNKMTENEGFPDNQYAVLQNSEWQLVDLPQYQQYQSEYENFTLVFDGNLLRLGAYNSFSTGAETMPDGRLSVSPNIAGTRMLVTDSRLAALEKHYIAVISRATHWQIDGQYLTLSGDKGQLKFIKK